MSKSKPPTRIAYYVRRRWWFLLRVATLLALSVSVWRDVTWAHVSVAVAASIMLLSIWLVAWGDRPKRRRKAAHITLIVLATAQALINLKPSTSRLSPSAGTLRPRERGAARPRASATSGGVWQGFDSVTGQYRYHW